MSKGLGALVFVAGVAGLTYWGAKSHAVSMENQIAAAASAVAAKHIHPLAMRVSGRDIVATGIADTEEDLAAIRKELDGLRGRRVVHTDGIEVLPRVDPFETALAKGAGDSAIEAMGYAPTEAAKAALVTAGVPVADLPLASGAPGGWGNAVSGGAAALGPLDEGGFALTGGTLTLNGIAATPVEDAAARAALVVPEGYDSVVAIEVIDPGVIDFSLDYDADTGFSLAGILPQGSGTETIAAALGREVKTGEVTGTFAELPGVDSAAAALASGLASVESLTLHGSNDGLSVSAEALAGLAPEGVAMALATALGDGVALNVTGAVEQPADGTERQNAYTGQRQYAFGGRWVDDPGVIDFSLDYDADTGFSLAGILPQGSGTETIAAALGREVKAGEVTGTFAELPGVDSAAAALASGLANVESLTLHGSNDGLSVSAEALAGLAPEGVAMALATALGDGVALNVTGAVERPADGTERQNAYTGQRQYAFGGRWVALPPGFEEPTAELCTEAAMQRVAQTPIRYVTGSAKLDPASMPVLDDLAGILNLCTRGPGMQVTIGGHTDAQGDPQRNFLLSSQRARTVKQALEARGVPAGKMIAIGYGQTRPVATNETEEGRAHNRRTTFEWPNN